MPEETSKRIAVLVSGTGTNLEAIIKAGVPVAVVIADRECKALEIAAGAGIPTELVERGDFGPQFDREGYTEELIAALKKHHASVVAMAGFMTFLSPALFEEYAGRVINTHPSLLSQFKGSHAVEDALKAGATETGCTIHIATAQMDEGPILAQEKVPVLPGDTVETLHERIKEKERALYPKVLKEILEGTIAL